MIVGFLGMSHLGVNYAVASAEKGFQIICYDPDSKKIENLKKNNIDFYEPGLERLLKKNKKKLLFTDQINDIKACNLVFLSQDVPTNNKNESSLATVQKLIKQSMLSLNKQTCFVILSQVFPGFTRKIRWKKKFLYYQVETLIFGQALNRIFNAERVIIGSFNGSDKINKYYQFFLKKFQCPIIHLTYESAEITKISINIFLISQVCTTNLLASICEKIGADWTCMLPALQSDRRIGKYAYLNPGLGLSGGNLERDLKTLLLLNNKHFIHDKILPSLSYNSKISKDWVLRKIEAIKFNKNKDKIAILGIAYKENTDSVKNSPSIDLIKKLKGYKIFAFDPNVNIAFSNNNNFYTCQSLNSAIDGAKILIIMNKCNEFKKISINKLNKLHGKNIVDPFGVLKNLDLKKKGFNYHVIGN